MKILGIIPARYASTRFPGKPLAPIAGKPLIQHVVEQCRRAQTLSDVIVATDDERIASAVHPFCRVEMTRSDHASGSDRVGEVAERTQCDGVVNIQGDEPLMDPSVIDAVARGLTDAGMSTAATPIRSAEDLENPAVVKVVTDASGRALYFSRRAIPFVQGEEVSSAARLSGSSPFLRHLGIYGYRRETLLQFIHWPVSALEKAEKLEQLRALTNGVPIAVTCVEHDCLGVDTPEDVARVERLLADGPGA